MDFFFQKLPFSYFACTFVWIFPTFLEIQNLLKACVLIVFAIFTYPLFAILCFVHAKRKLPNKLRERKSAKGATPTDYSPAASLMCMYLNYFVFFIVRDIETFHFCKLWLREFLKSASKHGHLYELLKNRFLCNRSYLHVFCMF